jgi:hypothetical protein
VTRGLLLGSAQGPAEVISCPGSQTQISEGIDTILIDCEIRCSLVARGKYRLVPMSSDRDLVELF